MKKLAALLIFIFFASAALAHKNHPHTAAKKEAPSTAESASSIADVNDLYKRDVKAIFQRSCFDCHSQSPRLPWYHGVPLVNRLIDGDMKEAKEHLDFTNDFPFGGHGNPKEDLEAIADSVRDGSMPPFRYRIMHRETGLNEDERKAIVIWAVEGRKLLEEQKH